MNPDFWRGRRVFITGHTGFKGSWLSMWLQMLGAEVHGYSLYPPKGANLYEIAQVGCSMSSTEGDIRNLQHLKASLNCSGAEIVFHLAAQPIVGISYVAPVDTYSTNVMGTVNLLEAVRTIRRPCSVVCITTDKCYENREFNHPFVEQDRLGGHDPYSNSKACAELVCSSYRDSYFNNPNQSAVSVSLATARAGNVIGGGDFAMDRLIPDILRGMERGEAIFIRNPRAVRPWQHVLEPLRGYMMLAEKLHSDGADFAEPWNFGPELEDCKPVSWIVEEMERRWTQTTSWRPSLDTRAHEAQTLRLNIEKSRRHLAWMPTLHLEQALDLVVDWHKAMKAGADMKVVTMSQIAGYERHINSTSGTSLAS